MKNYIVGTKPILCLEKSCFKYVFALGYGIMNASHQRHRDI